MKLCYINNLYPPHARGGAEEVVHKTVQGMLSAGHEVVVITTAPGGRHIWKEGMLTIYRYRPLNIFFYTEAHKHSVAARLLWHIFDTFNFFSARYINKILRAEKPDVVHTHNLMGVGFLIPAVIRRLKIRHVHTVHDVQLVEPSGVIIKTKEDLRRYKGLIIKSYTAIMKKLVGSPEVVISPSQFLLHFYEERGFFPNSKRAVLRNPASQAENIIPKINSEPLSFLYLGQIEEHKGVLFLISTFLDFVKSGEIKCILNIVGDGSVFQKAKEMIAGSNAINMPGKVARDKLPEIFGAADVTIVPSLCYENSPTVIFESFAYGVPVLASRVEGVAELISEGENGLTFETGNVASLQEKLAWCVAHREEIVSMSTKTSRSLAGLSPSEYVANLLGLYVNGM